jgi:WD40 repeat protein
LNREKLAVLYSDRMMLIWDMKNKSKIQIHRSFLSHNSTITDLRVMPDSSKQITRFVTSSTDKTVRIWNFYDYQDSELKGKVKRNIYCKELEKIVYVQEEEFPHFKQQIVPDSDEEVIETPPEDLEKQVRCVAVSPDGSHIATGDQYGYLRVYETETGDKLKEMLAHEQEVVCLDYSPFKSDDGEFLMASGSRDRLIHVFTSAGNYEPVNHLDEHTSSLVAV